MFIYEPHPHLLKFMNLLWYC